MPDFQTGEFTQEFEKRIRIESSNDCFKNMTKLVGINETHKEEYEIGSSNSTTS